MFYASCCFGQPYDIGYRYFVPHSVCCNAQCSSINMRASNDYSSTSKSAIFCFIRCPMQGVEFDHCSTTVIQVFQVHRPRQSERRLRNKRAHAQNGNVNSDQVHIQNENIFIRHFVVACRMIAVLGSSAVTSYLVPDGAVSVA